MRNPRAKSSIEILESVMNQHVKPADLRQLEPVATQTHRNALDLLLTGVTRKKAENVRRAKQVLIGVASAALLGLAADYGFSFWTVGRFAISTDDAYVQAD